MVCKRLLGFDYSRDFLSTRPSVENTFLPLPVDNTKTHSRPGRGSAPPETFPIVFPICPWGGCTDSARIEKQKTAAGSLLQDTVLVTEGLVLIAAWTMNGLAAPTATGFLPLGRLQRSRERPVVRGAARSSTPWADCHPPVRPLVSANINWRWHVHPVCHLVLPV